MSSISRRLPPVRIVTTFAMMVLLAACTGSGDNAQPPPELAPPGSPVVTAPPTAVGVDELALPIQAYLPTPQARLVLENAGAKVQTDCMRRFGFTDYSIPARTHTTAPENDQLYRRYGLTDEHDSTRYGYHLAPDADPNKSPKPDTGRKRSSSAEAMVLTGNASGTLTDPNAPPPTDTLNYNGQQVPQGGCAGESRRTIAAAGEPNEALVDRINVEMYNRSKQDGRVVAVVRKWSACMKEAGYTYADPNAAVAAFPTTGTPSPAEIQTAQADLACKKRTNLVGEWFAVESAYENAAIQQNIQQLNEVKELRKAAVVKAAGILGVPAPQ